MVAVRLFSASPLEWERIGEVLRIRGYLISEGEWTGMDGHTFYYPAPVIYDAVPGIVGKPIKSVHKDRDEAVVGFWTASRKYNGSAEVEGIVFDKDEMTHIENQEKNGLSMEADVDAEKVEGYKHPVARKMNITAGAVVENPACEPCRVESVARIRLARKQLMEEIRKMPSEKGQNPSREEFFKALRKQLEEAKVGAELANKIIEVLEGAIKEPVAIPQASPPAAPPTEPPATPPANIPTKEDIEAAMKRVFASELAKPTRAAFLRWLRKQFKEAGFETADIGKILGVIKTTIKTPYPYPYPTPKASVRGEKGVIELEEIWDETVESLENQVNDKSTEIETLTTEKQDLEKKLQELQDAENKRKEEEVIGLVNKIKEIDENFDAEKFLEGITCLDSKKSILTSYFETVQRLKPAIKLAGVAAPLEGEKKIEAVLESMFGTTELDDLIKPQQEGD